MDTEDRIFSDNVQYMKNLIGKVVEITTVEGNICKGTVFVIDPITKTVVLTNKNESKHAVDFILYNSIKSLTEMSGLVVKEDFLFNSVLADTVNTDELEHKKLSIKKWLKLNLIDVQEDGLLLKIGDELVIEPPYGTDQCFCGNVIVLDRIRKILSEMPTS